MSAITYELHFGGDRYVDQLLLYRTDAGWRVVAEDHRGAVTPQISVPPPPRAGSGRDQPDQAGAHHAPVLRPDRERRGGEEAPGDDSPAQVERRQSVEHRNGDDQRDIASRMPPITLRYCLSKWAFRSSHASGSSGKTRLAAMK